MEDSKIKVFSPHDESDYKTENIYDYVEMLPNDDESDFYDDDHNFEDYEDDDDNGEYEYTQNNEVKFDCAGESGALDINSNCTSEAINFKKCPKKLLRTPKCAR